MGRGRTAAVAFAGDVEAMARQLRAAGPDMARAYAVHATSGAAGVARRAVIRGGLRDGSQLTRRVVTSGAVDMRAARQSGGLIVADVELGGATPVRAGGRPYAGQVLFGSEWGGQRRVYAQVRQRQTSSSRRARGWKSGYVQLRDKPRLGVSVADQEAVYRAGSTRTRRTTSQFRPWLKAGYWMTPALEAAQPQLVEAWSAALDDVESDWARG